MMSFRKYLDDFKSLWKPLYCSSLHNTETFIQWNFLFKTINPVSKGVGGLRFQILVTTSYLTQIDTRQKDLQLSDT